MLSRRKLLTGVLVAVASIPFLRAQSVLAAVVPKEPALEPNTVYYVWGGEGTRMFAKQAFAASDWIELPVQNVTIAVNKKSYGL